jgi:(p)ppGpp synthase/HD superfamily hydrolase
MTDKATILPEDEFTEISKVDLVSKALTFATKAHEGQTRKYTVEPYINHPIRVMKTVAAVTDNPQMLAAALLHDVVEDSDVSIIDIEKEFGLGVALLVHQLTSPSKQYPKMERANRKQIDRYHLATAGAEAHTIKYADILDNVPSIVKHADPKFADMYVLEKIADMHVMTKGNVGLLKQVNDMLYRATTELEAVNIIPEKVL